MASLLTAVADFLMRQSLQIAAVFLLVAVVCWGLRKTSAHWRYLLWLVVLAKCLAPGLISVPLPVLPPTTEPQPTRTDAMHSRDMLGSPVAMPSPVAAAESEMALVSPEPVATRKRTTRPATVAQSDVHVARTIWMVELNWRGWLAAVWCSGVATCLTYISIRALATHRRLKRMRRVAGREIQATVAALAERLGLKMVPTVYMVNASRAAVCVGMAPWKHLSSGAVRRHGHARAAAGDSDP